MVCLILSSILCTIPLFAGGNNRSFLTHLFCKFLREAILRAAAYAPPAAANPPPILAILEILVLSLLRSCLTVVGTVAVEGLLVLGVAGFEVVLLVEEGGVVLGLAGSD